MVTGQSPSILIEQIENTIYGVRACVCSSFCHILFVGVECVCIIKWLIVPKLRFKCSLDGICIFCIVLCLPAPHFQNIIRTYVMRTAGFVQCCPADEPVSQCSVTQIDTAMLGRVSHIACVIAGCVSAGLLVLCVYVQDISSKQ